MQRQMRVALVPLVLGGVAVTMPVDLVSGSEVMCGTVYELRGNWEGEDQTPYHSGNQWSINYSVISSWDNQEDPHAALMHIHGWDHIKLWNQQVHVACSGS